MFKFVIAGTVAAFASAKKHPIRHELVSELKSSVSWEVHEPETNPLRHMSREELLNLVGTNLDFEYNIGTNESTPVGALPTNFDPRDGSKFPAKCIHPIRDQQQCGSCWAFSAVGVLESRYKIARGTLYQLAEQQLVDCATGTPYSSEGCNGGEMTDGFDYSAANGMMTEADYPYKAYDQSCKYDSSKATPVKGSGHYMVPPNNANQLKTDIANGPVSVAIEADTFVFQFYSGGVLNSSKCGTNLDHGVVAVGYGVDATKGEYYIVRNSWGASLGEKGYIRIAIVDGPGICGIQMEPTATNF
jgi:C1A family cysteine protease